MHISLSLRLTLFYALILSIALWSFGTLVYKQAEQRAYADLDTTLSSRAASVRLGKDILAGFGNDGPRLLNSVDAFGTGGVAIEVLDSQFKLLATTTSDTQSFGTSMTGFISSPIPWDAQALRLVAQRQNTRGVYSTITYNGQRVRVYTLLNTDFDSNHFIQTAYSEQDIEQSLGDLRLLLLRGAILVIVLALLGGWMISWSVLAMVRRMTQTARSIRVSHNLSQRVASASLLGRNELTTLADTFNQMLASLEEAYQQQQRFVADASHELRAPITAIRCNLDLLAKAPDLPTDQVQEALIDARSETARMGRLVNDLLLLAHADATHYDISLKESYTNMQPVDLDSLLLDVFRQYHPPELNEKQAGPSLLLQHITPVQVYGNPDSLKQVIVALIDNALKYTPVDGCVTLSLHQENSYAVVKISDTGIGMLPEEQVHIFERFYRANRTRALYPDGSGLGLAIVQSIMQIHRGVIEVESILGQGSTFVLHLPLSTKL